MKARYTGYKIQEGGFSNADNFLCVLMSSLLSSICNQNQKIMFTIDLFTDCVF